MPCVEIADAIVQTGRETLERVSHPFSHFRSVILNYFPSFQALETVRTTREWGAEVVYGDTDSLFISLPGKSKADAFRIGQEIADKVTSQNPRPIKLKFEKVRLRFSWSQSSANSSLEGLPSLRPSRQEAVRRILVRDGESHRTRLRRQGDRNRSA